jgi:aldose 1-epimerase
MLVLTESHVHGLNGYEKYSAEVDGRTVRLYVPKNANGLEVSLCNWGARVVQILTPDKDGRLDDITLGYDTLAEARAGLPEMGAAIGRVANRIAGARFELAGLSSGQKFI